MSLPTWVKARCRSVIRKPVRCMAERVANVKAEAYKHGYIYDCKSRSFVYVGKS